jgi:hypothetical protein
MAKSPSNGLEMMHSLLSIIFGGGLATPNGIESSSATPSIFFFFFFFWRVGVAKGGGRTIPLTLTH